MECIIISFYFYHNTVTYKGQTMPTGTIGCAALNIPDAVIDAPFPHGRRKMVCILSDQLQNGAVNGMAVP